MEPTVWLLGKWVVDQNVLTFHTTREDREKAASSWSDRMRAPSSSCYITFRDEMPLSEAVTFYEQMLKRGESINDPRKLFAELATP